MNGHISNLNISTFRGIRNLTLEDFGAFNILTGDNNCGKTSVLEVIKSIENPADIFTWATLARSSNKGSILSMGVSLYEGIYDLFDINGYSKMVEYSVDMKNGSRHRVEISFQESEEQLTESEIREIQARADMMKGSKAVNESLQEVMKAHICFYIDGEETRNLDIYDFQYRVPRKFKGDMKFAEVRYISPTQHAEGNLFLGKVLNEPVLYQEMLEVLQEFDPHIISINYDKGERGFGGVYKILSKDQKQALPLNMYGDGMKKAILLMSAVVASKGGILLLDEFETAIHTTAMAKVFSWILRTCCRLDVQLFLTTHSLEALDKVLKCCPELQNDIKVYTLYKKEHEVVVRSLSGKKALEAKDEMGLELR